MKSDKALDAEIERVNNVWNANSDKDSYSSTIYIASAVYRALRWARGRREEYPSVRLAKELERQ